MTPASRRRSTRSAVGLARAHRAEVADPGRERPDDGGHVELAVVGEHAHRVTRAEVVADLLEVAVGPLVDDLVGHREPLAGGEHRAGVAHDHAVAEHLGHAGQRAGEVDGAEDDHARRRRERLDEHRHGVFACLAVRAVVAGRREPGLELAQRVARRRRGRDRDRRACRAARHPDAPAAWPRGAGRR